MKIAELNKLMLAGRPVLTGTFQHYKLENSPKAGAYERFGILIGNQVHDFTAFPPKGTPPDKVVPPAFVGKVGTPVAVLDASFRIDGKYLRTGSSSIVLIEA